MWTRLLTSASLVLALDLPTMVSRAEHVAVVDVASVKADWDAHHEQILTTIDLVVVESWKGGDAPSSHLTVVQPGGTVGRHTHPGEEIGYVLEGAIVLEKDGKPAETLSAGKTFFIPAGMVHNATNKGQVQARVLAKAEGAPALASAANIAAFNLGNAGGAWLGGQAIEAGLGYTAPNWIGAGLAAAGLAVALVSGLLDRRTPASFEAGERVLAR